MTDAKESPPEGSGLFDRLGHILAGTPRRERVFNRVVLWIFVAHAVGVGLYWL